MTSIAKLKLIANAGDPDAAPALRVDVVAAAIKVLEAYETSGRGDFMKPAITDAICELLNTTRRYRRAVQRRGCL